MLALLLVSAAQSRQRLRHMQRYLCFSHLDSQHAAAPTVPEQAEPSPSEPNRHLARLHRWRSSLLEPQPPSPQQSLTRAQLDEAEAADLFSLARALSGSASREAPGQQNGISGSLSALPDGPQRDSCDSSQASDVQERIEGRQGSSASTQEASAALQRQISSDGRAAAAAGSAPEVQSMQRGGGSSGSSSSLASSSGSELRELQQSPGQQPGQLLAQDKQHQDSLLHRPGSQPRSPAAPPTADQQQQWPMAKPLSGTRSSREQPGSGRRSSGSGGWIGNGRIEASEDHAGLSGWLPLVCVCVLKPVLSVLACTKTGRSLQAAEQWAVGCSAARATGQQ